MIHREPHPGGFGDESAGASRLSRQEDLDKLVASLAPAGWSTTDAEEAIYRLFDALPDGDWPMAFDALVAMEVEGWSRAMSGEPCKPRWREPMSDDERRSFAAYFSKSAQIIDGTTTFSGFRAIESGGIEATGSTPDKARERLRLRLLGELDSDPPPPKTVDEIMERMRRG